jgi:hypothetical protein
VDWGLSVLGVFVVAVYRLGRSTIALLAWRTSPLKLMGAGAVLGVLRSRWWPLPGIRATL